MSLEKGTKRSHDDDDGDTNEKIKQARLDSGPHAVTRALARKSAPAVCGTCSSSRCSCPEEEEEEEEPSAPVCIHCSPVSGCIGCVPSAVLKALTEDDEEMLAEWMSHRKRQRDESRAQEMARIEQQSRETQQFIQAQRERAIGRLALASSGALSAADILQRQHDELKLKFEQIKAARQAKWVRQNKDRSSYYKAKEREILENAGVVLMSGEDSESDSEEEGGGSGNERSRKRPRVENKFQRNVRAQMDKVYAQQSTLLAAESVQHSKESEAIHWTGASTKWLHQRLALTEAVAASSTSGLPQAHAPAAAVASSAHACSHPRSSMVRVNAGEYFRAMRQLQQSAAATSTDDTA